MQPSCRACQVRDQDEGRRSSTQHSLSTTVNFTFGKHCLLNVPHVSRLTSVYPPSLHGIENACLFLLFPTCSAGALDCARLQPLGVQDNRPLLLAQPVHHWAPGRPRLCLPAPPLPEAGVLLACPVLPFCPLSTLGTVPASCRCMSHLPCASGARSWLLIARQYLQRQCPPSQTWPLQGIDLRQGWTTTWAHTTSGRWWSWPLTTWPATGSPAR